MQSINEKTEIKMTPRWHNGISGISGCRFNIPRPTPTTSGRVSWGIRRCHSCGRGGSCGPGTPYASGSQKRKKEKKKEEKKQKKDDSQDSGFSTSVPKSESTRGKWTLIKHGATNSILDISFGTWSIQVEMFSPQLTYELGVQRNVAWSYICNNWRHRKKWDCLGKVYRGRRGNGSTKLNGYVEEEESVYPV